MTRLQSLQQEAYRYGYDLFKESPDNHLPKLACYALCITKLLGHTTK